MKRLLLLFGIVASLMGAATAQTKKQTDKATGTAATRKEQTAKTGTSTTTAKAKSATEKITSVTKKATSPTEKTASTTSGSTKAEAKTKKPAATGTGTKKPAASGNTATTASTPKPKIEAKASKTTTETGTKATTTSKAANTNGTKKTAGDKGAGSKVPPDPEKVIKPDKPPQDNAGDEAPNQKSRVTGPNVSLEPEELANFETQPEAVQRLLRSALALTKRGLTYRYGSSDPESGGMDCSGTIYYLLKDAGIKEPPRDSSGMYLWTEKEGTLRKVKPSSLDDPVLDDLQPGDLMFWEGTYETQRTPPISHTMIYLGREKATGTRVMVGASDGRTYRNVRRNGVSVFDFKLPRAESTAKFVGYAKIPGLENTGTTESVR